MKALKHWKVFLVLALVFAAGTVTGSVWTTMRFKHAFERSLQLETWTADVMNYMQKELNLTPAQRPKVRAIIQDMGRRFGGTFGQAIKESGGILVDSWRRIDKELTPEQRVIEQRNRQKFRQGVKKALKIDLPVE
jgi:Spy/CpxP family protein refolding chaperone